MKDEEHDIEKEYPGMDWNRPLAEIEKDMTLIKVFGSVEFIEDFSDSDQEQLYRFARIVNNYTKLKHIEFLSEVKKYNL